MILNITKSTASFHKALVLQFLAVMPEQKVFHMTEKHGRNI